MNYVRARFRQAATSESTSVKVQRGFCIKPTAMAEHFWASGISSAATLYFEETATCINSTAGKSRLPVACGDFNAGIDIAIRIQLFHTATRMFAAELGALHAAFGLLRREQVTTMG